MQRNDFNLPESLWAAVEPLLPKQVAKPQGGRPPLDNYRAFSGIIYRLRTGCQWKALPRSFGGSSTVHSRFLEWVELGIFQDLYDAALEHYDEIKGIGWEWLSLDASMVKAPKGGDDTGPNPTDRAKTGSKRHVVADEQGVPIAAEVSAANVADCKMVEQTLDTLPNTEEHTVKPNLCMDKAYDSRAVDEAVRCRGIIPHTRRRGEAPLLGVVSGKPRRWKVERCNSWHNRFRGLFIRWDRKVGAYRASLHLASAIIVLQHVWGSV